MYVRLTPLVGGLYTACAESFHLSFRGPPGRKSKAVLRYVPSAALVLSLVLGGCAILPAQEQSFHAVVIGISEFEHLPKADWLEFAHADAQAFEQFIRSPRGRDFKNVSLLLNQEATSAAVRNRLGTKLIRDVKNEDTVYIFLATHGMVEKDVPKAGYLLATDSDREDLFTTALSMEDLTKIIQVRLQKARRIFLFADACRAGKLGQTQGNIAGAFSEVGKQRGGLLASRSNEFSREGKLFGGGHGVFTYYLLRGLMGEADKKKDNIVTFGELLDYVGDQVKAATDDQQHVREIGEVETDAPLAYVDKPGPPDWKLTYLPFRPGNLLAALAPFGRMSLWPAVCAMTAFGPPPEGEEVRTEFQRALREGRLLPPAQNNAWDLFQSYSRLSVTQSQKDALQDDLYIALADAGERILAAYRRGNQVKPLEAARYQEGAELFSRARQLDPDDPAIQAKARFMSGRALVARGRYQEALPVLKEAVGLDPGAAYSYNALGIVYMELNQWPPAIDNFRAASQRAEKWVYPHANLARVYAAQKRFHDAEQELKKGIQLGTELGLKYSYLHYNLGQGYYEQKRYGEAEEQFCRARDLDPDDASNYYHLGLFARNRGRNADAEANFRRAAELDPGFAAAHLRLAELYHQQGKRQLEEQALRRATAANPANTIALEALGRFLFENKKHADAEQVFLQMLAQEPASPAPLIWLGDVHLAQGNSQQAADDYRQALARTADPKLRRDIQRKLNSAEKKK